MIWRIGLWCALAAGLSAGAVGCDVVAPDRAPAGDPPADLLARPRGEACDHGGYTGVVTAVTPLGFELRAGWTGQTMLGRQQDHKKPKWVSTTGTQLGGDPTGEKWPGGDQGSFSHWACDLKVGDRAVIQTRIGRDGEEWAREIVIVRRPGGKIPVYRSTMPGGPHWPDSDQAEQDWEEKGIPIPAKYLNFGRADWTNPPYPPVAPQPREGKQ